MQVKFVFVLFFVVLGHLSCVQAAAIRDVFLDVVIDLAKKSNRHVEEKDVWERVRAALVVEADRFWTFHQGHGSGKNGDADALWDEIDDPLAVCLLVQELEINRKLLGRTFKKIFNESVPCEYCGELFTEVEKLAVCGHAFCDACLLEHYTTKCLCDNCLTDGHNSACANRQKHCTCPICDKFMGSDLICSLKKKPSYRAYQFKALGRLHRFMRTTRKD